MVSVAVEQPAAQRTEEQLKELKKAPEPNVICKVKAIYDYTAENREEEIDILEGDVIAVEYKVRPRLGVGWLSGSKR